MKGDVVVVGFKTHIVDDEELESRFFDVPEIALHQACANGGRCGMQAGI